MTAPGEIVGEKTTRCYDCKEVLRIKVLRSAAGYYIGFFCDNCGPHSRESGYFQTRELAEAALVNDDYMRD